MFVKLSRNSDGNPVYVNANLVSGITSDEECTCVWCCDTSRDAFEVKESAETVVMLLETALKGGFVK